METYRDFNSIKSNVNYHFVFCSRYRRKIFNNKSIENRFKQLTAKTCESIGIEVHSLICGEDYVHISLNSPPDMSPQNIMAKIKGTTSRDLRKEFINLQHLPSLWTRQYLVSTDDSISEYVINCYVEQQKTRG